MVEENVEEVKEKIEVESEVTSKVELDSSIPKEELKIPKEDHNNLMQLGQTIDQIYATIGSWESRKLELIAQSNGLKQQIDKKAKESLQNAGISKEDLEKYRIDLQSGKIVPATKMPPKK